MVEEKLTRFTVFGLVWSAVVVVQLDYNVTAEKLEEIFRIAGNVLNVELKMDKDTNKFRGMATVRFEHPVESVQAICILCFDHCLCAACRLQICKIENKCNLSFVCCNKCS